MPAGDSLPFGFFVGTGMLATSLEELLSTGIIKNCTHDEEASSTFDHSALCPA
jgi:hypothetical protein